MPKILIIADDLTGAADCAAASGLDAVAVLNDSRGIPAAEVIAIDANTRRMDAASAAEETARTVRTHPASVVYKKIDSTLRGHLREEIAAALEAYRGMGHPDAVAVIAPAFPAMGRITKGGRQYVRGVPIGCAGLPEICDASSDEDLRAIVEKWRGSDVLWAGSAGLMSALTAGMLKPPRAIPKLDGPMLFAIGSHSERSREQVDVLRESGVASEDLLVGEAQALARKIAERHDHIGALVLTGGDTARAVLEALGIFALRVLGEIEIGVPILIAEGPRPTLVVTKAGDFGDHETLARVRDFLRSPSRKASHDK